MKRRDWLKTTAGLLGVFPFTKNFTSDWIKVKKNFVIEQPYCLTHHRLILNWKPRAMLVVLPHSKICTKRGTICVRDIKQGDEIHRTTLNSENFCVKK